MFRKLVVVGLVVGLGSFGLGCSSKYPRYDPSSEGQATTCDLPDAPGETFYAREVQTEDSVKRRKKGVGTNYSSSWIYGEYKWDKSNDWTRYEKVFFGGDGSPAHLCTQKALDRRIDRLNPTTTTTTKASTVDNGRCRSAMKEVKRVLYTSDNDVFDNAFRVTLRVCGNRRTWLSAARAEGGSIDGMLTAACMLNGNTAVCKN